VSGLKIIFLFLIPIAIEVGSDRNAVEMGKSVREINRDSLLPILKTFLSLSGRRVYENLNSNPFSFNENFNSSKDNQYHLVKLSHYLRNVSHY
jgi:hypothetical protein